MKKETVRRRPTSPRGRRLRSEESWLAAVVQGSTDAIIGVQDDRIVSFNPGAEKLFGYSAAEALGRPVDLLSPPDLKREMADLSRRLVEGKTVRHFETTRTAKGGKLIDVSMTLSLVTERGRVIGVSAIARDITQSKASGRAQAQLAALIDSSDDAIVAVDLEGKIVSWNPAAERLYGYGAKEALGRPLSMLVPPDRADESPELLQRLKAGEHLRQYETLRQTKDGRRVPVSLSMSPIMDGGGVMGAAIITRDISERHKVDKELKTRSDALARSNSELEMFASAASHDLQEPLRKIIVFGELLEKRAGEALDAAALDFLRRMRSSAARMATLISDLLQLSRLGRDATPHEPVDLGAVLQEVLFDLKNSVAEASAEVNVPKDLPTVPGNPVQLKQLFQNLLSNALKFRAKGETPRVKVRWLALPQGGVEVSVADNGIGFEERFAEQIFQPFSRLNPRAEYEGTGIGLALCRRIAERHGGSITARSTPGRGSVFTVLLPR